MPRARPIRRISPRGRFCLGVEDEDLREELPTAFRGRGAFRMLRQIVNGRGTEDAWHRFRRDAVEAIAVAWLETNGIGHSRAPGRHEKERG